MKNINYLLERLVLIQPVPCSVRFTTISFRGTFGDSWISISTDNFRSLDGFEFRKKAGSSISCWMADSTGSSGWVTGFGTGSTGLGSSPCFDCERAEFVRDVERVVEAPRNFSKNSLCEIRRAEGECKSDSSSFWNSLRPFVGWLFYRARRTVWNVQFVMKKRFNWTV